MTTTESRGWEDAYRKRWQHDKIVRSTHGVNCTGSCSWKIYVKGGIVTWETQQTDYPRTRPDLPDHEPRGCSRGASYSWYLYSGGRLKYPLVRSRLLKLWREARADLAPVAAWRSIVEDPEKRASYTSRRGLGGFVRSHWDEVTEIVAAANAYTIRAYGPDRIFGFSPIPAMSMVSYAAGSRYLSLLGGVCMSFYDWYCDLPPSSPQTWGEQTDVPESADWYNSGFLILWGSNVPQTRTPDAHFFTEARYKGAKSVVICPDYSEASKFADVWLDVKQGTDAALAMAFGHVILREFHLDRQVEYFTDYCRRYTDLPMLVRLVERDGYLVPERLLRASDLEGAGGEANNPEWKPLAFDDRTGSVVVPRGSIGFRWGEQGKWNLEPRDGEGREVTLRLSLLDDRDEAAAVGFPYFGNLEHAHFAGTDHPSVLVRNVPAKRLRLAGGEVLAATVYDLLLASYGLDRGLGGAHTAGSYDDPEPLHPAWAEANHRHRAGSDRVRRARLRRQRGAHPGPLDGDHRGGDEPLVPHGHELPRGHQPAGDVRLRGPVGRGLVALRGPGEAAAPDRVAAARVRPRLDPAAPADELHLHVVRAHGPVALRDPRRRGHPVPDRTRGRLGRGAHRLQRAGGADGLAAVRPPARGEPARRRPGGRRGGPRGGRVRGGAASLRRAPHGLRRPRRPRQLAPATSSCGARTSSARPERGTSTS